MSTFKLFETDMKVPCDTFQCHERAYFFLGKEDSPKSMLTKICAKCAKELVDDIVSAVEVFPKATHVTGGEVPHVATAYIPFEEPPKEANLEDLTVAELKKLAADEGHEGLSKKSKADLIKLLVN